MGTEPKGSEKELQAALLYARSLIEASLDPLVTINPQGKITDVNQATEQVTGIPRERLIGSDFSNYFTDAQKAREGYQNVLSRGLVKDYPLTIRHASGRTTDVLYNATVYRNEAGIVQGVFAAARDITERKAAERRHNITSALTELFARKNSRKEYLTSTVDVIRDWSGCRCVGIRCVDVNDCIPYEACVGFDSDFQEMEGCLSLTKDTCLCIRAVTQKPDELDRLVMTRGGSFCCSNIQTFAKQMTPYHQTRYRGVCLKKGFKSLAIVPIQYREKIFAIIHLADERESVVTPNKVQFIETFAPLIGEAIHRFNAEAELARHRDHLEELVKQRTLELRQAADELARSNRDLEQFAYVASHDLQEPLRAVSGFMDLLLHNYGGELSGKALEYIEEASEGARRMQTLIEDLLKYSRVGTQGVVFEAVDANEALREAVAILTFAIRESNAIVTNDPLPVVWADATQLTQVFQNLIGNAIRFRGPQKPEVHISAKMVPNRKSVVGSPSTAGEDTGAKGGLESHDITGDPTFNASDETGHPRVNAKAWLFAVHDNGIGIEPRYHERIFMLFQRLHSRTQYPGTGIGLAVCKRIVERHGGNIWVQSQPGRGTTFYFTIPTQEG